VKYRAGNGDQSTKNDHGQDCAPLVFGPVSNCRPAGANPSRALINDKRQTFATSSREEECLANIRVPAATSDLSTGRSRSADLFGQSRPRGRDHFLPGAWPPLRLYNGGAASATNRAALIKAARHHQRRARELAIATISGPDERHALVPAAPANGHHFDLAHLARRQRGHCTDCAIVCRRVTANCGRRHTRLATFESINWRAWARILSRRRCARE
jgi:hypothetical protein